jgi:hypothetical protein
MEIKFNLLSSFVVCVDGMMGYFSDGVLYGVKACAHFESWGVAFKVNYLNAGGHHRGSALS